MLLINHGTICSLESDSLGYFGWPTVTLLGDGTLMVVASGFRQDHVCPFGRTVLSLSRDNGHTWSSPRVVHDSPLDDRDAGVVGLGGSSLLVSWFTRDTRQYLQGEDALASMNPVDRQPWIEGLARITNENARRWQGSWVRSSPDGGETWNAYVPVPVSAPHGPIRLCNGDLFYLGKQFGPEMSRFASGAGHIAAIASGDGGNSWRELGTVPVYPGTQPANCHEPHVVELPSGKLIGMIRVEEFNTGNVLQSAGIVPFSMMQTESSDGGLSWTVPRPLGFHGSPPHLIRHSSGVLVLSYGYRLPPYGQRVALSRDEGATWEHDIVLRDDGPDWDLGYPSSVELADGSILTVYYQKPNRAEDRCGLLYSRWGLVG